VRSLGKWNQQRLSLFCRYYFVHVYSYAGNQIQLTAYRKAIIQAAGTAALFKLLRVQNRQISNFRNVLLAWTASNQKLSARFSIAPDSVYTPYFSAARCEWFRRFWRKGAKIPVFLCVCVTRSRYCHV